MSEQEPPRSDLPALDYASVSNARPRRKAWHILGELFAGLVGGAMLMFTPIIFPRVHASAGMIVSVAIPMLLGLCLTFKRAMRIFGIGLALTPALVMLTLYAICGR